MAALDELAAQIFVQGKLVHDLQIAKADEDEIDEEVTKLLALRAAMRELCGAAPLEDNRAPVMPRPPKGMRDFKPVAMVLRQRMMDEVKKIFLAHGAVAMDTPVIERKEVLARDYGDASKSTYEVKDQGGEMLALRYDLTVPFARYLCLHNVSQIKRYQIAKVYRRDSPRMARGQCREFYQCDFDIAGAYEMMLPDAECLKVLHQILTSVNVGDFEVLINHRKLQDGMFEVCGVPADMFRTIRSIVDKLHKSQWAEVRQEMAEKGLPRATIDRIGEYVRLTGGAKLVDELLEDEALQQNNLAMEGLKDIQLLLTHCDAMEVSDKIVFDMRLTRGLDYYTGIIFEAVIKPISGATPREREEINVGSIAGGGRYDNLVGIVNNGRNQVPCVGLSIGIERIFSIVEARCTTKVRTNTSDVYVVSTDRFQLVDRMQMLNKLWNAGIKAEHSFMENPRMQQQLHHCQEYQIPYAIIMTNLGLQSGKVKLRDVATGTEVEFSLDGVVEEIRTRLHAASDL